MIINYKSLKEHMIGHGVPRDVRAEVIKTLAHLPSEAMDVLMQMSRLKSDLKAIADKYPSLTPLQKSLVARCYNVLKAPNGNSPVLDHQMVKEDGAIAAEPLDRSTALNMRQMFVKGLQGIEKVRNLTVDNVEPIHAFLYHKYQNRVDLGKGQNNVQEKVNKIVDKSTLGYATELQRWAQLPAALKRLPVWEYVFMGTDLTKVTSDKTFDGQVGYAGLTQEPGMKLRLFGSPFLMYQCALNPLKIRLQQICGGIEQDCHLDQESGAKWAQEQLRHGLKIYSIDLSSATHRFPWSSQVHCLEHLEVPIQVINLFTHVSKGDYLLSEQKRNLRWTAGQPLGTGPSFFVFSIAHHALVRGICKRLNVPVDCYRILGDDIVIADQAVAESYMKVIGKLGAVVNKSKTIISDELAEFAGFSISRDDYFRTGKMRNIDANNWLTYCSDWVDQGGLSPKRKVAAAALKDFVDFSPYKEDNVMSEPVHRYVNIVQSHRAADNINVADTIQIWDFANIIVGGNKGARELRYKLLKQYYHHKMVKLAEELCGYCAPSEWLANVHEASYRIKYGVQELLLELATCPTQCCPLWAKELMTSRKGSPNFMKVRRTLMQIGTAYQLTSPPRWMLFGDKFAHKLAIWRDQAEKLAVTGDLEVAILKLEEDEALRRTFNDAASLPSHNLKDKDKPLWADPLTEIREWLAS